MNGRAFCDELVSWYRASRRKLPWRGDEECFHKLGLSPIPVSAYGIWVSEVMSQQTRIDTVIPYWIKWMQKYPTVASLAAASPEDVNTLWAGLGYYRRCRYLLEGAKVVVEKYGGEVPCTVKELLTVPGIGPYTAGAIASIAYGVIIPAVDGNVLRVMSRVCALEESINTNATGLEKVVFARTMQVMQETMPTAPTVEIDVEAETETELEGRCFIGGSGKRHVKCKPGDFNQALMELGALVCTPTSPACEKCRAQPPAGTETVTTNVCPVQSFCKARAKSVVVKKLLSPNTVVDLDPMDNTDMTGTIPTVTIFPMKSLKIKKAPPEFSYVIGVIRTAVENGDRHMFLFSKRPSSGLLAGQWEFPSVLHSNSDSDHSECNRPAGQVEKLKKVKTEKYSNVVSKDFSQAEVKVDKSVVVNNAGPGISSAAIVPLLIDSLAVRFGVDFGFDNGSENKRETVGSKSPRMLRCIAEPKLLPDVITHVFSHQVHKMHVVVLDVEAAAHTSLVNIGVDSGVDVEWMSMDELVTTRGCTTGCKKVLTNVAKHSRPSVDPN